MPTPAIEIRNDRAVIDGRAAEFVPTVHVGGRIEPTLIILHDTAGGPPGDSVSWLRKNPNQVSAHVIIKPDGSLVQLADFDRRTNHAWPSTWRGRSGCNGFSIGIEIVNPGQLYGTPSKATATFGRTYSSAVQCPADQWHKAGLWLPYTEAQLATVEALIAALGKAYPTISEVVGHHHVSPGRKVDPTPLMPWDRMRAALGKRAPDIVDAATIKAAQVRLAELLYQPGTADGLMGPRTRAAIRTFQEQNKLPITGQLTAETLSTLHIPGAKEMPTGTRDAATAAEVAAAGSTTVKAANKAEVAVGGAAVLSVGNAVADATEALAKADAAVRTVESSKSIGSRIGELAAWAMTPRGAIMLGTVVLIGAVWLGVRHIRARRVAAHQEGRQA